MSIVYPGLTLGVVGFSSPIIPYVTQGTVIGQLTGQPITAIGCLVTLSPGANLNWSIQVSNDNPQQLTNWLDLFLASQQTVPLYTQILFPITALRLAINSLVTGTANLGVVQWP